MIKWQKIVEGQCERLSEVPEDAYPIEIEGLEVQGFCASCGIPLLENDRYQVDLNGDLICADCLSEVESAVEDDEEPGEDSDN